MSDPLVSLDLPSAVPEAEIMRIAATLREHEPLPVDYVRRIVQHLGVAASEVFVAQALEIEAVGGMVLPNESRRRTLGGIFFRLVKQSLPKVQRKRLFSRPAIRASMARLGLLPPPPPPPASWATRAELIAALHTGRGTLTTVKIMLMGRPAEVSEQADFTLLNLTVTRAAFPTLPRGVPLPEPVPPTTYSVFIGKRQWKQVAESLKQPKDVLIVEGTQMLNAAGKTIVVFATSTTTKLLRRANRMAKPPAG